jgi:Ca-activated chloride channel family protein
MPSGARPRSAPRGRFGVAKSIPEATPGRVRHSPDTIRPQLSEELARLRTHRSMPLPDRMTYLADLGSRLSALAAYLGDDGPLASLARDLTACETPGPHIDVEALWHRALTLLATLTGESPTSDTPGSRPGTLTPDDPSASTPRRPFWKRS